MEWSCERIGGHAERTLALGLCRNRGQLVELAADAILEAVSLRVAETQLEARNQPGNGFRHAFKRLRGHFTRVLEGAPRHKHE